MRKTTMFVAALLALSLLSFAAPGESGRYLVKSDNEALKGMFGVQHSFGHGFTADLNNGQLRALEALGVGVEEVAQYSITAKKPPQPPPEPAPRCTPAMQVPYGVAMVNGGSGGSGVTVAVLDTGVLTTHPDLRVSLCRDTTKRGIINGCSDGNGHGTHVAGTVAAMGGSDAKGIYGVAPGATLWAIKVCGNGGTCSADDMAEGIRYAADQGANIISMSIGSDAESSLVKDAISYAAAKGVLVIAAAGNDGPEDGSIDYPGANPLVVAVAAIDAGRNVANWSSRGVNDGDYIVEEREVELAAPGVAVLSTYKDGCYATMSGTSMATPHVSGLAAKLWQGSAIATRAYLQNISQDIGAPGDDTATGFGLPVAP